MDRLVYVTQDTGVSTDLWPSFRWARDGDAEDRRHRLMTLEDAGRLLGELRGMSNQGLSYDPRPDLVRSECESA